MNQESILSAQKTIKLLIWLVVLYILIAVAYPKLKERAAEKSPSATSQSSYPVGLCAGSKDIRHPNGVEKVEIRMVSPSCWSGEQNLPSDWRAYECKESPVQPIWVVFEGDPTIHHIDPDSFPWHNGEPPWWKPLGGATVFRVAGKGTLTCKPRGEAQEIAPAEPTLK